MFCQNGQCTLDKKPVEWFDLSRQLFLARHAACVAVKSAFLRDHLNAAACQVCNRPIRQLPVNNHQLPITSLSPIARCPQSVGSCQLVCASVAAASSGALICRRKLVAMFSSALALLRLGCHCLVLYC